MKLLNFGSCNIDLVYSVDHIVKIGETEKISHIETFPGGKGLNQSVATAKAGATIYHAGYIGADGDLLEQTLIESGVNTQYLKRTEEKNGCAIIQVSADGDNSILIHAGSNQMITIEDIDAVLEHFDAGDCLLLQNEISHVDAIIQKAHKKGMLIFFNPSPVNEMLEKIDFHHITYLILNEVEVQSIAKTNDTRIALKTLRETYPALKIVLTLGEYGCIYADTMGEIHQPSFQVPVIDTTAAGDTFTGYFLAETARGTKPPKALQIASAASAIAISRKGAAPSIPTLEEVLSIMDTLTERTDT